MVEHIVLWNFIDSMNKNDKYAAGLKMKELLEPIGKLVPGAVDIKVVFNPLDAGNKDVALFSRFRTEDDLRAYQIHPAHVEAGKFIKSVTCNRSCFDYQLED